MEDYVMGKSMNGPDWTDVAMYIAALDALHGVKTGVLITSPLDGKSGILNVRLVTSIPVPGVEDTAIDVVSESAWPCKECGTLAMHVYGGLYRHDYAIGQAYQQRFLPGVE